VIPISAIFVYGFNYNLLGPVAALVFGYTVGGVANAYLILQSNWEALSAIVIGRNAAEGLSYDEYDWDELPPHVQESAGVLGYNKNMWETGKKVAIEVKDWNDLSRAERDAATMLGYDRRKWDGEAFVEGEEQYDTLSWGKLPFKIRKAAKVLGYNKKMWNADQEPALADNDWDELSPVQQEAATTLGYDRRKWDSDDESGFEDETGFDRATSAERRPRENVDYDDCDWDDLPLVVQKAALTLGYNQSLWDANKEPSQADKYWRHLNQEEREAAETLGYNEEKWDTNGSTGEESSSSSEAALPQQEVSPGSKLRNDPPNGLIRSISEMYRWDDSRASNQGDDNVDPSEPEGP
jgi:hypothetical protein